MTLERLLAPRGLVGLAAAGSASVLIAALLFQAAGYAPCHLCIEQRWPHLAAAVLGALIVKFGLPMWTALLGAAAALATGGLGIYHSLVERKLIAGPDTCTSSPPGTMSASDLLTQLQSAPLIRCDEIAWQMFGITMPNLNALFSLVFAALWIAAWLKSRRA